VSPSFSCPIKRGLKDFRRGIRHGHRKPDFHHQRQVDQVIPDMIWGTYGGSQSAQVQLTFNVINFPGDAPTAYGPYTVTSTTEYISVRFRGRQMSVTVTSSDSGSFWRIGRIRYRYSPAGRR
jgi:hypothetical protein